MTKRKSDVAPDVAPASDINLMRRPAYRPSLAMRIAAQRAAVQPPLGSAVSNVDNWRQLTDSERGRR